MLIDGLKWRYWGGQRMNYDASWPTLETRSRRYMAYSGMKDNQGVKIWEHDIVEVFDERELLHRGTVEYHHGEYDGFVVMGECEPETFRQFYHGFLGRFPQSQRRVRGNIYDNPKLLETTNAD